MNSSVLHGLECERHSQLFFIFLFLEFRILKTENVNRDKVVLYWDHSSGHLDLIHLSVCASFKHCHPFLV